MERLESELGNLRAALGWSAEQGQAEAALRLGVALLYFWQDRELREGRESLAGLLALPGAQARTALRAKALERVGWLATKQRDFRSARALFEERLAIFRELGDNHGIAGLLLGLGWVAHDQGDHDAARAFYEERLTTFRELGDKSGIARSLRRLGEVIRDQGEYGAARALLEECRAIYQELGDENGIAVSLLGLAQVAQAQGDSDKAEALLDEGEAHVRRVEDRWARIPLLGGLGHLTRDRGDYRRATALYQESLRLRHAVGDRLAITKSLEDFAVLAGRQGQAGYPRETWVRAARLLGAAEAQCAVMGASPPLVYPAEYDRTVAAARGALGEEAFAAAWAEGRALSLEEAVRAALAEELDPPDCEVRYRKT